MKRLLLLIALLFFSCSANCETSFNVLEVIDGDTIRLSDGTLLRYIGIDTPEVRRKVNNSFVYDPQPFSLEAKEFNRKLVEGKVVRVEYDAQIKDRYGRLLGYCYVGNDFVNAKLVEAGLAFIYTFPPNLKYADLFLKLQRQARENHLGVWGENDFVDLEHAADFNGKVATVRGKVLKVYQSSSKVFLNFGRDYKTDFTVVIPVKNIVYFKENGVDPLKDYLGKMVAVTGKITKYNGPQITARSPFEIEIIP